MYCSALAIDFDGTGATNGQLAPEVAAALGKARAQGMVALLVTGRVLDEVQALCGDLSLFDAVVAENGALICFGDRERLVQLGEPPPEHFFGELRARGVPFHAGAVVVGTWDRHAADVLALIRRFGLDAQLVFNREAMMVLPSGINKAVGTRRALIELSRSERSLIAFGDAENDLPLLAMAEVGVAARGAVPTVAAQADDRLKQPGGAGVATYVHQLLEHKGVVPTPSRHSVPLGYDPAGALVTLPGSGTNVMITGDPRSGKSWLAGLVAERLIEHGYRLCIIDPEGDYLSLDRRANVLLLGHQLGLPDAAAVPGLLRNERLSLILSLATLTQSAQLRYVNAVLDQLGGSATLTGIPHWIVIDEAHYFFGESMPPARLSPAANYLLATYRPSLLSGAVFSNLGAYLITRTAVEEERYFVTSLLQAKGPPDLSIAEALADLDVPRAGLLLVEPTPRWVVFTPSNRLTAHAHHGRKYADIILPEGKAFRFLQANGTPLVAHNVVEFHRAVQMVPVNTLRHHLANGDFSRWVADVLGDAELAHGLRKLERATATGAAPSRDEILAHIEDRYLIEGADPHAGRA